jgi:adenosylcobyric acid synthase
MVCGTSSGAGKSFLTTALCRWYARQGLRVAPFKAQNMSNNARVVAGGEIGSAQYFQALAARAEPEVRMNPVLLKPEADTRSQVVLLGRPDAALSRTPWRERSPLLWPAVKKSLHALLAENDLVVIEGAGSPAEINLMASDIVNLRVAAEAGAATIIVADIDRGGAFAHLYGTHQLLPPAHRALIRGFVLNKFRGDAALLAPAPADLEALTGVPTLGVLPMWRDHGLPEEDGVFDDASLGDATGQTIAIVAYPRISNLDEFAPLRRLPRASVRWARRPDTVRTADVLILPGSKNVAADVAWLRATGLDEAIRAHVAAGKPVLAICGGLQLLGHGLRDPHGVEGSGEGLGLLPYQTTYAQEKETVRRSHTFGALEGHWAALSGITFDAYEIHHGKTEALAGSAGPALRPVLDGGAGWQRGSVLAVYTHGLFENAAVLRALFGAEAPSLEDALEGLADYVDEHLGAAALRALLAQAGPATT